MSHNKIKIGTAKPNQAGELSPNLNDLNNVTASNTNNTILKYNGSNWINASLLNNNFLSSGVAAGWSMFASVGSAYSVNGSGVDSYRTHATQNWPVRNSTAYFESGNITLNRGSHAGEIPTQTRFSRVELNANGKYILIANTRVYNTSSTTYIEWQWLDTSTDEALSARWRQYGGNVGDTGYCIGFAEVTSGSRVCDIRCIARDGGNDGNSIKADIISAYQIG